MAGLFSRPKTIKPPPIAPPPPLPQVDQQVGARARRARPRGRRDTFLTGDLIPAEDELKKKRLG